MAGGAAEGRISPEAIEFSIMYATISFEESQLAILKCHHLKVFLRTYQEHKVNCEDQVSMQDQAAKCK